MLERGRIRRAVGPGSVPRWPARGLAALVGLSAAAALFLLPAWSARAQTEKANRSGVAGSVTVDYIVPTRDAQLFLEVVHHTDAAGHIIPAPVIPTYTPYAVLGRNGDASHWVLEKGYTRATADVIGTGNSGGCYDYGGGGEKRTAHDLVEW